VFDINNIITIQNIYKIYNEGINQVAALNDISIAVDEGEFIAIVGKSGSGKSTLMNILGCLDTPTSGEYTLNGENVAGLTEKKLTKIRNCLIGFVFQGFNLISGLDALENVELPLFYRGIPRAERRRLAQEALCEVGLSDRVHHLPSQMSGGNSKGQPLHARSRQSHPLFLQTSQPGTLIQSPATTSCRY